MAFAIDQDGEQHDVEIDVTVDPGKFTLRELVRLEDVIGTQPMALLTRGELDITPKVLQAIVWTKLASVAPEVPLESVDLPAGVFGVSSDG